MMYLPQHHFVNSVSNR